MTEVHFGFNEKGEPISIPLFQMFFDATTGHGKTVGMKSLVWRFHLNYPDWKILIIDSKDKRDYADLNADIPICFVETTEPLDLKNLLEPFVGSSMMYYLDKIIEEAIFDTLSEMQKNIERKINQADKGEIKIHGKELGKLRVLNHLLKKLIVLVDRPEITDQLILHPGFNVMPVSLPGVPTRLKRAYQWLIVRSVMLKLTEPEYEKILVILDEFHKWSPQRWASIVKQIISENVSEGRGKQIFYWMADQALAKVDKEPLKPVKVWVVGQQLGTHEVRYAIETVNDVTELVIEKKDIKGLKVGHFIIVDGVHHRVERAYLQPCGVPDELAKQIATGQSSPEDAELCISNFKFILEEEEELYRQKYEDLLKQVEEIRAKAFEMGQASLSKDVIEDNKFLTDRVKELEANLRSQEVDVTAIKALQNDLEKAYGKIEGYEREIKNVTARLERAEDDVKVFQVFRETLAKILPVQVQIPVHESSGPSEISVTVEQPAISVKVERKPLHLTDKGLEGKIAVLYAEGRFPVDKWFTVTDVAKGFEAHGWSKDPRASKVLDQFCQWGLLEKGYFGKRPQYRLKMRPDEAKAKGLLKVEESNV